MVTITEASPEIRALQGVMQLVQSTDHPSATRLLEGVRQATAHLPPSRQIATYLQIRHALGLAAAVISNWKARGVSESGALAAEERWGVPATWILTGAAPPRWATAAASHDLDPVVTALDALQQALAAAPDDMRDEIGEALQAWARRGGRDAYRRTVEALLDEARTSGRSGKRARAGG